MCSDVASAGLHRFRWTQQLDYPRRETERPNGCKRQQVEYNGHPLYTYSGDTAPGRTNGEGLLGKWFVSTPSLSVQGGGSTSGGYGNGY
ncbi:MAG: hypothetical protein E6J10_02220 [Chloroflexi bacterium]|nr:MAG: hypothetical protein E6J10_02220 [Chloroflexota bacterium]